MPRLAAVACVVVIIASIGAVANTVRETLSGIATPYAQLEQSASTNAVAAHVTLTNTTAATRYGCFRAIVKSVDGKHFVHSAIMCSGDLKPHTSVSLDAPYDPGAVLKICSDKSNSLDWDLCSFDVEPVTAL